MPKKRVIPKNSDEPVRTSVNLSARAARALAFAATELHKAQGELLDDALRAYLPTVSRHAALELSDEMAPKKRARKTRGSKGSRGA